MKLLGPYFQAWVDHYVAGGMGERRAWRKMSRHPARARRAPPQGTLFRLNITADGTVLHAN